MNVVLPIGTIAPMLFTVCSTVPFAEGLSGSTTHSSRMGINSPKGSFVERSTGMLSVTFSMPFRLGTV